MTPEQFKDSMSYLGIAYGKEFTQQELTVYYDFLKEFSDETLVKAIKNIIKTSKFMPKINELVEECENSKEQARFEILEYMKAMGYFKESGYAISEYEKAIKWLETGVIPHWFKDDMTKYYKMMKQERLSQQEQILIG